MTTATAREDKIISAGANAMPQPASAAADRVKDLLASVVVFLVALPLCMGIAIASGVPATAGLVTGIIGGIVVGALAGSPLLVSGPAAGLAVLVFELVREHGLVALGPVVLLGGLIQVLAGVGRVGLWFRMVSPAVVNGMLAGIGILIIASQLHVMFDAKPLAKGLENFGALPMRLYEVVANGAGLQAGLLGIATIALMVGWDKLRPSKLKLVPGALVSIVAVTVIAQLAGLDVKHVALPDNMMASIQWVAPSDLSLLLSPALLMSGLAFALIASAETLLCASAVDRMHDGPRTKFDKELFAQGVGNVLCGIAGGLPMTGVIVRSSANVQAGATSRLSAILHGVWMLAFVLLLPWLIRLVPVAGLAGILVATGFKMIKPGQVRELAEYGYGTVAVFVLTTLAIVATDLLTGVALGLAMSLLRLAIRSARLHLNVRDEAVPGQATLRLVGSATFLNVPWIARQLDAVAPGTVLKVDISRLLHIDHACLVLLQDWARTAYVNGSRMEVDWEALDARTEGGSAQRELVLATG
jgi:MFS superfamily sulfate permease-like transporter